MITVDHLSKTYGGFQALDDVTFTCRPGTVTGFLGPNGAGKTTTLRVMVGLTPASSGPVLIGGHAYADIPNPGLARRACSWTPRPSTRGRTGREILTIGAQTMGLPGIARRRDAQPRLARRSRRPSAGCATTRSGMKQRLGIAHALLGDPSVLILDEPANGLDPAGIRWMRTLLKGYADRGGTVLLSSHLLNEVELIADEMVLIGRGRIVAQGDKQTLLSQDDGQHPASPSLDDEALMAGLKEKGFEVGAAADEGLRVAAPAVEVGRVAAERGIVLTELRSGSAGLEDLFLELTSDTQRDTLPEGTPA